MNTKKILIIGQALPAVKQAVPYDTTMLYEMLEWTGITMEQAQKIFEFEAVVGHFPGHGTNGHLKPNREDAEEHYNNVLADKIDAVDKIILLGNVAKDFLNDFLVSDGKQVLCLTHPSRRNQDRIMKNRLEITEKIAKFVHDFI